MCIVNSRATTKHFFFNFESIFIKAGDSETKEGLRTKAATGKSLSGAALTLQTHYRKEVSHGRAPLAHWEVGERRPWTQFRGSVREELLLPTAPLGASLVGSFKL